MRVCPVYRRLYAMCIHCSRFHSVQQLALSTIMEEYFCFRDVRRGLYGREDAFIS